MHPKLLEDIVALCRRRQEQGDFPTEPAASVERLENAIVQMADHAEQLKDAVRSARADEAHCWAGRVDGLTLQLRAMDERYMTLVKAVADGVAMQPAQPILVAVGPNVRGNAGPTAPQN